jgi:peptidoglycan/LPS O-acetylase OafA/YrhL
MGAPVGNDTSFVTRAPKIGFVGGFDGIRGIGIMMVLVEHASAQEYFNSFNGIVDVFFVISGFLITSLLLQEHRSNGRISLKKFYSRRALRLFPGLWLMLGTVTVLVLVGATDEKLKHGLPREILSAFFYCYHLFNPVGYDLFHRTAGTGRTALITPMWSLSVEEQFYLIIAVAIIWLIRRNALKTTAIFLAGIVVVAAWSRWNFHPGPDLIWFQRPDGLAIGVILAIVNAHLPEEWTQRHRRSMLTLGTIGLLVAVATMWIGSTALFKPVSQLVGVGSKPTASTYGFKTFYFPMRPHEIGVPTSPFRPPAHDIYWWWRWGFTATALGIAPVVFCLARYRDWWANRVLSWAPLRYLGRLSYTLYVWHWFIFQVVQAAMEGQGRAKIYLTEFVITFAVALAVYYGVERRVLTIKLRFSSEREVVDLNTGKMVTVDVPGVVGSGPVETVDPTESAPGP